MTGRIFTRLTPTADGLALGAGTIVARRDNGGSLAIDGREAEILALLSVAYGKLMPARVLCNLRAAAKVYAALTETDFEQLRYPRFAERLLLPPDAAPPPILRVTLALALTGLPSLHTTGDTVKAARCLVQAQNRLRALSPLDILKIEGLLPKDATTVFTKDYNPDEPRDAQGRWTGDGDPPQEDADSTSGNESDPVNQSPAPNTTSDLFARPAGVPEDWIATPTKRSGGIQFTDPQNSNNYVRIMPGRQASPYPNSQNPYVRWQLNGQALDVNGNMLPTANSSEAHIPVEDFEFIPDIFDIF